MNTQYDFPISGNSDLNLSAFLLYCGFELVDIVLPVEQTKERHKNKFGFIFKKSELLPGKIEEYFSENTMVDAKRLFACRQFIRRKIAEKQAENTEA